MQDPYTILGGLVNLASPRMGSLIISVSDEFFAAASRMLADSAPVFVADKFDEHGKWMDGWETRRRRGGGHDWALIKLGAAGIIEKADINTQHFTGNYPHEAKLEGSMGADDDSAPWQTLIPQTALCGDSKNELPAILSGPVDRVKLNIYPDGGIARLRLYGRVVPGNFRARCAPMELSSLANGGRIIAYSDAHYGDVFALLSDGRGKTMGDGWETRRRRGGGYDWIIIALGGAGRVQAIEVDTAHFKGNYPDSCTIQGALLSDGMPSEAMVAEAASWSELLPGQKLRPDHQHRFNTEQITNPQPINHVRLCIYPDGGVSRLRIMGAPA